MFSWISITELGFPRGGVTFAASKGIYTKLLTKITTTAMVMTEVTTDTESFVKRSSLFSTTFEISVNLEEFRK